MAAAFGVAMCLLSFLGYGIYAYWDSPPLINFLASWIPFILSLLLAFIPSGKEMKHPLVKYAWRTTVVFIGFSWSFLLWHQQSLTDKSNLAAQTAIVTSAVDQANAHSDQKFAGLQTNVGALQNQVTGVGLSLDATKKELPAEFSEITKNLGASISKAGKPDPPVPARLVLSLWVDTASGDKPVLEQTAIPDKDGNVPVSFTFINASDVAAENIDIWIEICTACSFAAEPAGFDSPKGSIAQMRHRIVGTLNPGTNLGKFTLLVKYSPVVPSPGFQIEGHYSCKTCGKMQPPQIATIYISAATLPALTLPQQ